MQKSRFTDSQILVAIKRVEAGVAVLEMCRELGISSATFYKWRAKYGGMDVPMMSRMKELEAENAPEPLAAPISLGRSGSGPVRSDAMGVVLRYNHERSNTALDGITPKQRLAMAA